MIANLLPSPLLCLALLAAMTWGAYRRKLPELLVSSRHVLLMLTAWAWLCCTPVVVNFLMVQLEGQGMHAMQEALLRAEPDSSTAIIVLGSGQMWASNHKPAPRLDENGWERLHAGVQLWRRTGGTLIFTGGPGDLSQATLAALMGNIAVELGVPRQSISLAVNSQTTYEDLLAAQALVAEHKTVWLVTSAMHMPRALAVMKKLGINARPLRVDYRQIRELTWRAWLPSDMTVAMTAVLHEIVGQLVYRWRAWSA